MKRFGRFYLLSVFPILMAGCSSPEAESNAPVRDQPMANYQRKLLDQAFEIASAIQVNPHIKDRSRAQEKVIQAALDLDQPVLALTYSTDVANWRRGLMIAEYADYSVQHGVTNGVPALLKQAEQLAWSATQEWRRDSVLKRISLVNERMAHPEQSTGAAELAAIEKQFAQLSEDPTKGELDVALGSVELCIQLYKKDYQNEALRLRAEEKIKASWSAVPVFVRIKGLQELVTISLENDDAPSALRLLNESEAMVDENSWPIEYRIPLMAQLSALRYRAGDVDAARATLHALLKTYQEKAAEMIDIDRADALIPLAESFEAAQEHAQALEVYRMAVEAAMINGNSRPRAEDLSSICVSLALHQIEPDPALWTQLDAMRGKLGAPW